MPQFKFNHLFTSLLITLLTCGAVMHTALAQTTAANPNLATVGRIIVLEGQGWLIHQDETRERLAVGLPVLRGDQVQTQDGSSSQIGFNDDSVVTVRPASRLGIEDFAWNPESGTGRAVLELFTGAFRAISGLIAKRAPETYQVKTPVALIGVRGTDFGARYCADEECKIDLNGDTLTLSEGIYIGVLEGEIESQSPGDTRRVKAGEAIYQKDAQSAARSVQNLPGMVFTAAEIASYRSSSSGSGSTSQPEPDFSAFITDSTGKIIRDGFGRCVRSSTYSGDHNVANCR